MAIVIELPPDLEEELSIEARRAGLSPAEQSTLFLYLATALVGDGPDTPFRGAVRSFLARHRVDPDRVSSACDQLKRRCLEGYPPEDVASTGRAIDRDPIETSGDDRFDGLLRAWRDANVHQPIRNESGATARDSTPRTSRATVASIRGKYAYLGLSSEDFAREKQLEIDREDRI